MKFQAIRLHQGCTTPPSSTNCDLSIYLSESKLDPCNNNSSGMVPITGSHCAVTIQLWSSNFDLWSWI